MWLAWFKMLLGLGGWGGVGWGGVGGGVGAATGGAGYRGRRTNRLAGQIVENTLPAKHIQKTRYV